MEYNVLKVDDVKSIIEGKLFMLPNNFNVIKFSDYLKIKDFTLDQLLEENGKINIMTRFYLDTIEELNDKHTETIIPFFTKLEEYENQALLGYSIEDFDSDMRYVGKKGTSTLKEIIRKHIQRAILSDEPYLIATSYDVTALFKQTTK